MRRIRLFMPCIRRRRRRRHTEPSRARASAIAARTPSGPGAGRGAGVGRLEAPVADRGGHALVRVAKRDARAHERLGGVGREQEWIRSGRGEPLPVELEPAQQHDQCPERAAQVGAGGEDGRLVLLQVAVVGERQALDRREQAGEAADRGARLAAHELGDVGVELLRHHRRAGRRLFRQARRSRTRRSSRARAPRRSGRGGRSRSRPRRGSRARSRGRRRRRASCAAGAPGAGRSSVEPASAPAPSGLSGGRLRGGREAAQVALEHLHPREQVMTDRDRLGALEVRVARHRRLGVRLGALERGGSEGARARPRASAQASAT